MDIKTLSELDYFRIREEASMYCVSEEGRKNLSCMMPYTNEQHIEELKKLSYEWQVYNSSPNAKSISAWKEVKPIFKIMNVEGATLTQEQTHALLLFCISVQKVSSNIKNITNLNINSLQNKVLSLPDIKEAHKEISRIITNDGEIKDLDEIREIKTKIANLNKKIQNIMHSYISNQRLANIFESTVPVLRSSCQVLAIKASHRNRIRGIIHEVSPSGQTVYIEVEEAVLANNELRQEEANLQIATRMILQTLTKTISPFARDFEKALPIMITLDTTCAISRWGSFHKCNYSLTSTAENPLTLIKARHPLLAEKAVPIDVKFLQGTKILIITGPNTGGKTVTLKTIALFALLNQSGFPIPADENSYLPIFSKVFADIGDGQSLDDSLSTFGSHMKNIANALSNCDEHSLVLLDELGSGTDAQEGCAIGMAVLDELIKKDAYVLVTTHQGALKNYGWTHEKCVNASVEFNNETLSPTYNLLMGIPGESRALDIAEKNGLSHTIVEKARSYIEGKETDISSLIKGLTSKYSEAEKLLNEYKQKEAELFEKESKVELKILECRKKELELKEAINDESAIFLSESRKKLENLVRVIREGEITKEKTKEVKSYIENLTTEINNRKNILDESKKQLEEDYNAFRKISKKPNPKSNKPTKKRLKNSEALKRIKEIESKEDLQEIKKESLTFKIGAKVTTLNRQMEGEIISNASKKKWQVQFGTIKMIKNESDLILIQNDKKQITPTITIDSSKENENTQPVFELRLLGLREKEAIKALEEQIDLCAIKSFKNFSIIHGKGNGILQQAVHTYLSHSSIVKDFSFAPPEDGGTGKTYVTLH